MSGPLADTKAVSETRQVERVYAALARVYDTVFDWVLRPGRLAAVRAVDLRQGHRVLEVGVGTGLSLGTYPVGTAVLGVDSEEFGQEVKAIVVPRAGASAETIDTETLALFCREKLSSFKVPTHWEVRADPLPRNAAGKILKNVLSGEAENNLVEE